jgi:hypothetical protein
MRRPTKLDEWLQQEVENLGSALALHFACDNMSLKGAIATMAAGLTDRVWNLAELLQGM